MQKTPQHRRKDIPINDWSIKKERLLRYWQEECRLYNWLYIQNVESYQLLNKVLSLISIILTSITGTTLLNQSSDSTAAPNNQMLIAFGIVSLLAGMVSSVKEFMDFGAKINANINCARQNSCIVNDIDEQLNMERDDRVNGREFMKIIKDRKNELIQNGPMISRGKWNKLQKQINSGQGINFFNKKLFKEYMDQTINMGDIDFHMPGDDDGSPDINDLPKSKASVMLDEVVTQTEYTPTTSSVINTDGLTATTSTFAACVDPSNDFMPRSVAATNRASPTPSHIANVSEDEYIANMNSENLCSGPIRQLLEETEEPESPPSTPRRLFRFRSRGKKHTQPTEAHDASVPKPGVNFANPESMPFQSSESRSDDDHPTHKYDPLLQYQLTRL